MAGIAQTVEVASVARAMCKSRLCGSQKAALQGAFQTDVIQLSLVGNEGGVGGIRSAVATFVSASSASSASSDGSSSPLGLSLRAALSFSFSSFSFAWPVLSDASRIRNLVWPLLILDRRAVRATALCCALTVRDKNALPEGARCLTVTGKPGLVRDPPADRQSPPGRSKNVPGCPDAASVPPWRRASGRCRKAPPG